MICVMADTHGDYSRFSHKILKRLKKNDYLIVCGDFGFVWDGSEKENAVLKKIGSRKFTTLFLTGSHDNYSLLEKYPEESFLGGRARNICGNLYMLISGNIFGIDGKKIFVFGGGQSPDIEARIENGTWWEQEMPSEQQMDEGRRRLAENRDSADYIFTHEPPASIAEFLNEHSAVNRLNVYFDSLKGEIKYKMWFFGKLHKNKLVPPKYMAVFDEPYVIE